MASLPNGVSQEQYYGDASSGNRTDLQGHYQYTTLKEIIESFQLMYTGDNMVIPADINRDIIIFHAKRGLQELNYDALKEIKGIEVDIDPDTLTLILPDDFVSVVRVSWVDNGGNFHPLILNADTRIAAAYLQDNLYEYLYDSDGKILTAAQNSYDETNLPQDLQGFSYVFTAQHGTLGVDGSRSLDSFGGRFGMETSKANFNGWYTIDKTSGVMKFSSNIAQLAFNPSETQQLTTSMVVEYISDGLESDDFSKVRIHKFAVSALYSYIDWMISGTMMNVQEYIVRRKEKKYFNDRRTAKLRLSSLNYENLYQALKGRDKRLDI